MITSKSLIGVGRSTSQMPHSDALGRRLSFFTGSLSAGAAWAASQHGSSVGFSQSQRKSKAEPQCLRPDLGSHTLSFPQNPTDYTVSVLPCERGQHRM